MRSALEAVQAEVQGSTRDAWCLPGRRDLSFADRSSGAGGGDRCIGLAVAFSWPSTNGETPVAVGEGGRPAIAVISFDNMAGTPETAWLSRGVPSMLLTGLAQTRGLDIVSGQRLQES